MRAPPLLSRRPPWSASGLPRPRWIAAHRRRPWHPTRRRRGEAGPTASWTRTLLCGSVQWPTGLRWPDAESGCRSGGTGRRMGLKIPSPPGREGSSPSSGTSHIPRSFRACGSSPAIRGSLSGPTCSPSSTSQYVGVRVVGRYSRRRNACEPWQRDMRQWEPLDGLDSSYGEVHRCSTVNITY